jgi:hypothetical protein
MMKITTNQTAKDMSIMTKLLVNHLSYFTMISIFDLDWRAEILKFLEVFNFYTSTSPQGIFSYECFLNKGIDTESPDFLILMSFSPILLFGIYFLTESIVLFGLYKMRKFFKRCRLFRVIKIRENHKIEALVTFGVLVMNIYPTIMIKLLDIFRCVELTQGVSYMKIKPEIECWSLQHSDYIAISSVFVIIWGLGYPLFLYKIARGCKIVSELNGEELESPQGKRDQARLSLKIRSKEPYSSTTKKKNGWVENKTERPVKPNNIMDAFFQELAEHQSVQKLVIKGYRGTFYYWETVVYLRKLFVILISLLRDFLELRTISAIVTTIFFVFFFINEVNHLYSSPLLQKLETYSLLIAIASINFGLLSSFQDVDPVVRGIFLLGILGANSYFFIVWLGFYLKSAAAMWSQMKSETKTRNLESKLSGPLALKN